jgi:hypothetical protein
MFLRKIILPIYAVSSQIIAVVIRHVGASGSVVVKALCYKPEDRGFDTLLGDFLNLPNPSGRTKPWDLFSL